MGDLHEEYLRILHSRGAKDATRWYWSQALLSIPSLLSYSRSYTSALGQVRIALITLVVLAAMLLVHVLIGQSFLPLAIAICIDYANAALFGAILARLVGTDGVRVAFFASLFLVLCFIFPALAGHPGSQAPLVAWIALCGAIPAMCLGAGLYQSTRRKLNSVN
jgi:hypothetical protein